jgi:dynactin-6
MGSEGRITEKAVTLGDYVTVEVGAIIEAGETTIGDGTVIGVGSRIGRGAMIGKVKLTFLHGVYKRGRLTLS